MNIEYVLDDITKLFRENLQLMLLNDSYLINLKKQINNNNISIPLSYRELLFFAEEALADLINIDYLYDFRDIE